MPDTQEQSNSAVPSTVHLYSRITQGRLGVEIRDTSLEAGHDGIVSMIISNPFDTAIDILDIGAPRSPHLQQSTRERPSERRSQSEKTLQGPSQADEATPYDPKAEKPTYVQRFRDFLTSDIHVSSVGMGGVQIRFPGQERSHTLSITADEKSKVSIPESINDFDTVQIAVSGSAEVLFENSTSIQSANDDDDDRALQRIEAHCEAVVYIVIAAQSWLFSKPTKVPLSTQISYTEVCAAVGASPPKRTQVVSFSCDLKPPLKSMVIGSIAGAIVGTAVRELAEPVPDFVTWRLATSFAGSILMSLIAVVALSRKTGAQGFITVEDFVGGFVAGALIGYSGKSIFERVVLPETVNNGK